MDPITISLILALIPIAQKLIISGVEIWVDKSMTTAEIIAALDKSKAELTPMVPKE
jgi:hypothetical protein